MRRFFRRGLPALFLLGLLCLGWLSGCGPSPDTPGGALLSAFHALKQGDLEPLARLSGEDTVSQPQGYQPSQVQQIVKSVFRPLDLSVEQVQENEEAGTAQVTLSGSTADYTALLETVLTQTREQFTTWATENRETFAGLSTEGLQEKMVGLLLSNLESAGKSVQTVPVDQVLSMHKQEGEWQVDSQSADALYAAIFGSASQEAQTSLQEILSRLGT